MANVQRMTEENLILPGVEGVSIKMVHVQEVLAAVVTVGEGVDTLAEVFKLPRI